MRLGVRQLVLARNVFVLIFVIHNHIHVCICISSVRLLYTCAVFSLQSDENVSSYSEVAK